MNTQKLFILFILTALLFACVTPAQPPAAPPATQPPTQPPPPGATSQPTPAPYNLDVTVVDPDGQPIPGASAELDGQTVQAGFSGIISFSDLSAGPLALTVSAPGYQTQQLSQTLQPGDNPVEVVLQPDPFALLPGNACAEGETLLYLEDFQDGQAQGWDAIEGQVPGWSVEEDAGQPGNQLAAARGAQPVTWAWYDRQNASFENVIWRLRAMTQAKSRTHLNFRFVENPDFDGRYFISTGDGGALTVRLVQGQNLNLGPLGQPAPDEWHLYEIAYFNGELTVFVDGEQQLVYQDPQPWEGGTLNLEPYPDPDEAAVLYDNLSLCGLSAAPQPLPKPKTGYDLTLSVTDAEGLPVSMASVTVADAEGQPLESLTLDATGTATLSDLPVGALIVTAGAPGYLPLEQSLIIEKGEPAELSLALERDSLGLAPEQACAANETLLYIEDFNDGQAQGWPNIQASKELNAQNGWTILEQPSGNILLQAADGSLPANDYLQGFVFDDAVWRLKVLYEGNDTDGFLNWRRSFDQGDWRYFVPFGGLQLLQLIRFTSGEVIQAAQSSLQLAPQKWHLFEISTYQGDTEVWLDGKKLFTYTDPQPLPPGTIGLEMHLREGVQTVFWFDDLAVCGLSAPFEPLPPLP